MPDSIWTDWKFWSALIALVALIKTELPPINRLFKRRKFDLTIHDRIAITHTLGNPNVNMLISFRNTCDLSIVIKSIVISFNRGNEHNFSLSAREYFPSMMDEKKAIFTHVNLRPGEEWSHVVSFYDVFSRNDEDRYRQICNAIQDNIGAKRRAPGFDKNSIAEVDQNLADAATSFFWEKFKWERGEYTVKITASTEQSSVNLSEYFRFTLFESDSNRLINYCDGYKIGLGVCFFDQKQQQPLSIPITPL